jgi:hypothetical protein
MGWSFDGKVSICVLDREAEARDIINLLVASGYSLI